MMCVSVPFSVSMSMLVPIVLVVGTKDCLQTMAMLFIAVPSFMCVNCLLVHMENIYIAYSPFFDVVCTQVNCLPINNYEKKMLSMSLDSILVSSVVSVSGPYTERVYISPLFLFWYVNALFTNTLWKFVVKF